MRYLSALFEGYIGFYNGMGLNSLYIDFTKCKNRIVVIRGSNGVGKSTLLNALNLFPDPSNAFIPGMDGNKALKILHNQDVYDIRIQSFAENSGSRKTKCFIAKNGLELNDNGNVTSYKDILFSEFDLDSNFISLTRLSSTNKGLGLQTPAERKRFVSNIVDNLEIYNDIYKTLNKRSTIFKSQVNNLHTKIQNIGSRDALDSRLFSLETRAKELNKKITENNNAIVSLQAKYSFDNEEVNTINKLNLDIANLDSQIGNIESRMNLLSNRLQISKDKIKEVYELDKVNLQDYSVKYEGFKSQYDTLLSNYNTTTESINSLEASLISYTSDIDTGLEDSYKKSSNILENSASIIKSLGYECNSELITPLTLLMNFFKDLITGIDSLYDDCSTDELVYICTSYEPNRMDRLQTELSSIVSKINQSEIELNNVRSDIKKVSILDNRPKKCNINDCPFIKDAYEIKSKSGKSIYKRLDELIEAQFYASTEMNNINKEIELCRHADIKKAILDRILLDIDKNIDILNLFHIDYLVDKNRFLSMISSSNNFNSIRYPEEFIELRNQLSIYDSEKSIHDKLEISYKAQSSKLELLKTNNILLDKLKSDRESILADIESSKSNLTKYKDLKDSYSSKVDREKELVDLVDTYNGLLESRKPLENKLNEYNKKSSQLSSVLGQIEQYKNNIKECTDEMTPLNEDINRIKGQLILLDSYYREYNDSKSKFDIMETLKKYCSPTGCGIQVLFIQLYMAKTLDLSNQILSMLFNGEYRLLDFVINQNEFRIPFIGNGLPVDDISSGSESQICMMSMIINLVLLHQASTKFNICRLDEIDAPLDYNNRAGFVSVLYQIINILNIEQLFIISHNTELDATIADVIKLKYTDEYGAESNDDNSNIIFDYSKL